MPPRNAWGSPPAATTASSGWPAPSPTSPARRPSRPSTAPRLSSTAASTASGAGDRVRRPESAEPSPDPVDSAGAAGDVRVDGSAVRLDEEVGGGARGFARRLPSEDAEDPRHVALGLGVGGN